MTAGVNPKDLIGDTKPDLSLVPEILELAAAAAMSDGARKYGPFNWRDNPVRARVYIAAAKRHLKAWAEGQELTTDTLIHHLGAVAANVAILLDAQAHGCLVDDRHAGPFPAALAAVPPRPAAVSPPGEQAKALEAAMSTDVDSAPVSPPVDTQRTINAARGTEGGEARVLITPPPKAPAPSALSEGDQSQITRLGWHRSHRQESDNFAEVWTRPDGAAFMRSGTGWHALAAEDVHGYRAYLGYFGADFRQARLAVDKAPPPKG